MMHIGLLTPRRDFCATTQQKRSSRENYYFCLINHFRPLTTQAWFLPLVHWISSCISKIELLYLSSYSLHPRLQNKILAILSAKNLQISQHHTSMIYKLGKLDLFISKMDEISNSVYLAFSLIYLHAHAQCIKNNTFRHKTIIFENYLASS